MPTYNVRADGLETTALNAVGDISDPANAMTLATLTAALAINSFSPFDIITLSSRGGELQSLTANNIYIGVNDLTIEGDAGYNPNVNLNEISRVKIENCSRSVLQNFNIHNNAANNCEWNGTGTDHEIRNVESYNAHTDAGAAAFSNELAAGTVRAYGVKGHDANDDGWSAHGGSKTFLHDGCEFYNNAQGINGVGLSTIYDYGSKTWNNSVADVDMGSAAGAAYFYSFGAEYDGAVLSARVNATTVYFEFHGTTFNCNALSSEAAAQDGCVHFGNGTATRVIHSKFYGVKFTGSMGATKAQVFLRGGTGSTNEMSNIESIQPVKTGYAIWDLMLAGDTSNYRNMNIYNATIGIHGAGAATQIAENCNYDSVDTKYSVAPDTIINETIVDSGFIDAENGDFRHSRDSALIGAGVKWWGTDSNPIGSDGEPFSDFDTDIGSIQSTYGAFHPANL